MTRFIGWRLKANGCIQMRADLHEYAKLFALTTLLSKAIIRSVCLIWLSFLVVNLFRRVHVNLSEFLLMIVGSKCDISFLS